MLQGLDDIVPHVSILPLLPPPPPPPPPLPLLILVLQPDTPLNPKQARLSGMSIYGHSSVHV